MFKNKLNIHYGDCLWNEILKIAGDSKYKNAAISFISTDNLIDFGRNDSLIVNASDNSIKNGATSAQVLESLFNNGCDLYSIDSLHAKLIVFDNEWAYIGSANISKNSKNRLIEAGVITNKKTIVKNTNVVINELKHTRGINKIDAEFIERISGIEVINSIDNEISAEQKNSLYNGNANSWLVSVHNDFEHENYEVEGIKTKEGEEWDIVHFPNSSRISQGAQEGDYMIIIYRQHEYDDPESVYQSVSIQKIFDCPHYPRRKCFAYAINDEKHLPWTNFIEIVEECGIHNIGSGRGTNRLIQPENAICLRNLLKRQIQEVQNNPLHLR